jgi:hypothetical protein
MPRDQRKIDPTIPHLPQTSSPTLQVCLRALPEVLQEQEQGPGLQGLKVNSLMQSMYSQMSSTT